MTNSEYIILVDRQNRRRGVGEKIAVHQNGLLHRAFSIFLVTKDGCIIVQKRHPRKYHSGGLWANTCCGHPRPGEKTMMGARRRLFEEVGATASLNFAFRSHYTVRFQNGLIENEIVSVYVGLLSSDELRPNPLEVAEIRCVTLSELIDGVNRNRASYAFWLVHYLRNHRSDLEQAFLSLSP